MEETATKNYNTTSAWRLAFWPMHQTASSVVGLVMTFVSYLATGYYGILVATVGYIATATRLLDAWVDPFLASITDRIKTKYGRIRLLIIVGRAIQILSIFALFYWFVGKGVAAYTVIYCVYVIGASICAIATHTGNAMLTNDPVQRPKIFRWTMTYSMIMATFASYYFSKILFRRYGGINIEALHANIWFILPFVLIFETLAIIAISQNDRPELIPEKKDGTKVNPMDCIRFVLHNRAMQMYLISGVSDKLAQNSNSSAVTVMLFGILINNYEFNGTFRLWQLPFTLAMLWFVASKSGKKGSRDSVIRYSLLAAALSIIMILFFIVGDPTKISRAFLPTAIFAVLSIALSACSSSVSMANQSLLPDIIDYEYYRSGAFLPGVAGVTYSFIDEFVSSLGSTISATMIAALGYVSAQPQPGDPVTTGILWTTLFLSYGMPLLMWLVNVLAMKFYPLTPEFMKEIQEVNRQHREEAAAKLA